MHPVLQQRFRNEARAWIKENFPEALKSKLEEYFQSMPRYPDGPDWKLWKDRIVAKGWGTPAWPKAYGGAELPTPKARIVEQELVRMGGVNPVLGMGTLLGKTKLEPRQRGLLDQLSASARLLLGVINDVLDLSRIEAGKQELSLDEIDTAAVVEDCVDSARSLASGKDVTLSAEVPSDLPRLVADRVKVKQVLLNLLSNAVRFTKAGRIVVRVSATAEGIRFAVSDTGVGIPAAELPRLFEPFHRAQTAGT